jgi:hypothetical protein
MATPPGGTAGALWQKLLLPAGGTYTITAAGAAGYNGGYGPITPANGATPAVWDSSGSSLSARCRGAILTVNVTLPYGRTTIYALVGQISTYSGGGGGTFILDGDGTPLLVAGGGGTFWSDGGGGTYAGCDGSLTSTSGQAQQGGTPAGGTAGAGGTGIDCSGGAGLMGNATSSNGVTSCGGGVAALAALNNGTGGAASNDRPGGFGGGGRIGGGGGYSGGSGPSLHSYSSAGGGGSFCPGGFSNCAGTFNFGCGGTAYGNGYVLIMRTS